MPIKTRLDVQQTMKMAFWLTLGVTMIVLLSVLLLLDNPSGWAVIGITASGLLLAPILALSKMMTADKQLRQFRLQNPTAPDVPPNRSDPHSVVAHILYSILFFWLPLSGAILFLWLVIVGGKTTRDGLTFVLAVGGVLLWYGLAALANFFARRSWRIQAKIAEDKAQQLAAKEEAA